MPFFLLLIAALLFLAALRDTHGTLGNLLAQDVPGFIKWALAIVAIGALGLVPALKDVSRYLLALVLVVIVVTQYKKLFSGFTTLDTTKTAAVTPPTDPATAYALNPVDPKITSAGITGTASPITSAAGAGVGGTINVNAAALGSAASTPGFDPASYLADAEHQLSQASGLSFLGA